VAERNPLSLGYPTRIFSAAGFARFAKTKSGKLRMVWCHTTPWGIS